MLICRLVVIAVPFRRDVDAVRGRVAMPRTKYAVVPTDEHQAALRTLVGRGVASTRRLVHARILLKADQGEGGAVWAATAMAVALEVHVATVARVQQQFVAAGLEAALERRAPQQEYAHKLDGDQEAHLVAPASGTPRPAGRWRAHGKPLAGVACAGVSNVEAKHTRPCHV